MKPKTQEEAEKMIEDMLLQNFPEEETESLIRAKLFAMKAHAEMQKMSLFTELAMAQAGGQFYAR